MQDLLLGNVKTMICNRTTETHPTPGSTPIQPVPPRTYPHQQVMSGLLVSAGSDCEQAWIYYITGERDPNGQGGFTMRGDESAPCSPPG